MAVPIAGMVETRGLKVPTMPRNGSSGSGLAITAGTFPGPIFPTWAGDFFGGTMNQNQIVLRML